MADEQKKDEEPKEMMHKTKTIHFLGRTTPIVLQNDNGPCPLLAICNVLLLRNNLNLSSDATEVSQEKLLSLVAERLIDSNSNIENKDAGFVENQQQNIADAIDLLPRLATGIDVNIKFKRIDDFEFTRECAIFDLLDIPLYHGWIVDPQDTDTADAIALKSYNTLMGELVALETQNQEKESKKTPEEDSVDFVAATTASLGVPSPSLSRGLSFDESPCSVQDNEVKKDHKEEELLRVSEVSESVTPILVNDAHAVEPEKSLCISEPGPLILLTPVGSDVDAKIQNSGHQEQSISDDNNVFNNENNDLITFETNERQDACSSSAFDKAMNHESNAGSFEKHESKDAIQNGSVDVFVKDESSADDSSGYVSQVDSLNKDQLVTIVDERGSEGIRNGCEKSDTFCISKPNEESDSSNGIKEYKEPLASSAEGNEPIYEGEECILESRSATYEDREPMYEGEVGLAEQVDKGSCSADDTRPKDSMTAKQGELLKSFLKNSASQLTVYGLFCLQDGLKERELCVFFRNNHFNTMFKFDGELYLLATDQGFLNQPDLVWEKLNEVNGDTVYMTGNFKEFKVEDQTTTSWDEHNAVSSTADYIASIDMSEQARTDFNSDLQLAIALQQQEFEQQPQAQRNLPQSNVSAGSRMVTGPQRRHREGRNSSSSSSGQEPKSSKEKGRSGTHQPGGRNQNH